MLHPKTLISIKRNICLGFNSLQFVTNTRYEVVFRSKFQSHYFESSFTDFVLQVKMIVSETISATDSEENYLKNLVLYKKELDNFHRPLVQSTHYFVTRMHSSRMRTARSSSCWRGSASVHAGIDPWVWAWRSPWLWAWIPPLARSSSTSPLGVDLETPWPDPPQFLPWV